MPLTKAQVADLDREILKNVEYALDRMNRYVSRKLASGKKIDRRLLQEIAAGLDDITEEAGRRVVAGKWGTYLLKATSEASARVSEAAGRMVAIDRDKIASILFAESRSIKDILEPGVKIVNRELLGAVVGGKSLEEVSDAIEGSLVLEDEDGEYDVPKWRADMIARNELFGYERMAERGLAQKAGLEHFQMIGPDDERTADDVCSDYLDQVHTVEEWDEIAAKEFEAGRATSPSVWPYGFHYGCRHAWVVALPDANDQ